LNRSEVVIGLAIIVLSVIFFYPVLLLPLVDLMIALLIIGFVLLVDGYGGLAALRSAPSPKEKAVPLSGLDLTVLQMMSEGKNQDDIAKATGVSPAILSDKVALLVTSGYVSGSYLTEKGFETLRSARPK